jgi:hypothetical protein
MNGTVSEDVKLDEAGVEFACRAIASDHYSKRFATVPENPIVTMNVDGNWHIFEADATRAIRAYLAATKPPLAGEVTRINMALLNQLTDWFNRLPGESLGKTHFDALIAIVTASPPMPVREEGFVLVPVEPTPEMIAAFEQGFKMQLGVRHRARFKPRQTEKERRSAEECGLRAMLAASPPKEDSSDEYPDGYRSPLASERKDR